MIGILSKLDTMYDKNGMIKNKYRQLVRIRKSKALWKRIWTVKSARHTMLLWKYCDDRLLVKINLKKKVEGVRRIC